MSQLAGINEPFYETSEERGGFHVMPFLWHRKGIILLGLLVGLGLGYLYFTEAEPVYQSKATMLMIEMKPALPSGGPGAAGAPTYTSTADTHEAVILSPMLIGRAIADHDLKPLPSMRAAGSPVGAIISNLSVESTDSARGGQHVVTVSYQGTNPDDCEKILAAVIETYQKFLGDTYQHLAGETVALITEAKDVLHRQLTEKEGQYRAFRSDSPLMMKGTEGGRNLHESRMAQIESARTGILVENSETKARLEAIEEALRQGGSREALTLLIGQSDPERRAQNPRSAFEEKLFMTLLEEQMLLESYGSDHPRVIAQRKKMDLMRGRLAGMPDLDENHEPVDFLAVYLDSLRQELKTGEERLAELNRLFDTERQAARSLVSFEIQDETFRTEIARSQQLFDVVMRRLEEISLIKDYNGVETTLLSTPSRGHQVAPILARSLGVGGMLGLLAGLGLAYLVELADKRFRSPEELTRELQLPILAHVPVVKPAKPKKARRGETPSPLDRMLCTYHHGKGRDAEAYRAVRTSLYFSAESEKLKVIQVTSPNPSDGKTTLAGNLAVAIARSGKRVLLVDADFRRPKIHTLFGIDGTVGLSAVMAHQADLPDAVFETPVENLWVVPCGRRPHNPADLLASRRFDELLQVMREQYDVVLVDTPPLLAVTDPSVVAPRADGVILVARLTKHARGSLVRSAEMLASVGGNTLGVVVNGMGQKSTYGDGSYRSGYTYRYSGDRYGYGARYSRAGYGYGYGDTNGNGNGKASHAYYTDEAT